MLKIKHPASSLSSDAFRNHINAKSNLIELTLETISGLSQAITVNRAVFMKGCSSQLVAQAAKNHDDSIRFTLPEQLDVYFRNDAGFIALIQPWVTYLCLGELIIQPKTIPFYFTLACSFQTPGFFKCMIDQNVKLPIKDKLFFKLLLKCFDTYKDPLSVDGKYNFIWWVLRTNDLNWLDLAQRELQQDNGAIESFIIQFILYKSENGLITDMDISDLIEIYKSQGQPSDKAKQKVKGMIKWECTPVEVLEAYKTGLRFSEDDIRKNLQKRLHKLQRFYDEQEFDPELIELKEKRDQLKKRYEDLIKKKGEYDLQMHMMMAGNYEEKQPPRQTATQSNQNISRNNQQSQSQNQSMENFYKQEQMNKMNNSKLYQYNQPSSYAQVKKSQNNMQNRSSNQEQQELDYQLNRVLDSKAPRYKPEEKSQNRYQDNQNSNNDNNNNYKPSNSNAGSKFRHSEQRKDCTCKKSFRANCGCELCIECFNMYYITKTQKYEYFEMPKIPIQPQDPKKYGAKCYLCQGFLNEKDVAAYNGAH